MSYYTLPKNYNKCDLNPTIKVEKIPIYASYSTYNYYNKSIKQLINICLIENNNTYDTISKFVNTYEYIFTKIPEVDLSISKLKQKSGIFYDLIEISTILNIFEDLNNVNIKSLIISPNFLSIIDSIQTLKNNKHNKHTGYVNLDITNLENSDPFEKFNLIFCELDNELYKNNNNYIFGLIQILLLILKYQNNDGITVIKIYNVYHKPIIDILYILTYIFEKVYIIKPNTSNIFSCDKYIICKKFTNNNKETIYSDYYNKLYEIYQNKCHDKTIHSIISSELPYYFINKIDDMNIIIGQQQLEIIHHVINLLKNKNKTEKLDILKKNNIQKCMCWCEKHNIPYNNIFEKTTHFVPSIQYNKIK